MKKYTGKKAVLFLTLLFMAAFIAGCTEEDVQNEADADGTSSGVVEEVSIEADIPGSPMFADSADEEPQITEMVEIKAGEAAETGSPEADMTIFEASGDTKEEEDSEPDEEQDTVSEDEADTGDGQEEVSGNEAEEKELALKA